MEAFQGYLSCARVHARIETMKIARFETRPLAGMPDKREAIIYLQGCPWRCPFCGNPELLSAGSEDDLVPEEGLLRSLRRRLPRLTRITVSGGEPTLQPGLPAFLLRLRRLERAIHLETNGFRPAILNEILHQGLVDFVAMDVKAPLDNYTQAVGCRVDSGQVRESIFAIRMSGIAHEFRTTVVPGLHTSREIKAIGNLVRGGDCYVLQTFRGERTLRGEYTGRPAFPERALQKLLVPLRRQVGRVEMRLGDGGVAVGPESIETLLKSA